ncbi:hypothetical protein [Anaeromyxobacter sp. SG64]|uniref:hypothetical protein n=1 Tax=Anaeromyxobacter sp. SG64 TaxID=2925409 RepID=UPI001F5AF2AE|nr:hypothetical protein [Anaeromyxobacter sp. SG64]
MNRYLMKAALHGIPGADADAVIRAAEARGVETADDHLGALTLAAMFPEHMRAPLSLTPAERLQVFERLVLLDPRRAAAFRDDVPGADSALKIATEARDRDRAAIDAKRRDADARAWSAERRLVEARESLRLETLRIRDLEAQRGGPFDIRAALDTAITRGVALTREVQALETTAHAAREESARLTTARP